MGSVQLAGVNNANGYSDGDGWSPSTMPVTRQDGSGGRAARLRHLELYVSGRGGARTIQFYVMDAGGAYIAGSGLQTIGAGSGGTLSGFAINGFVDGVGQYIRYGYDNSGGLKNFGRAQPGIMHTSTGDYDGYLGGNLYWSEPPTAPSTPWYDLQSAGRITVYFSGAGVDNGGDPITGWYLQYATNPSFVSPVTVSSGGTNTLDLTPGQQYWFRACGLNGVVTPLGRVGQWSGVATAVMLSGGKVRKAGAWVDAKPKIRGGGVWKDPKVMTVAGGLFVPAK